MKQESDTDKPSPLLKAFQGRNKTVPVWFMRQAGRFLPEYRALREKHSLEEMFTTPELAAEVTCMPIDILGVDAAILFADILTLPAGLGFDITFDKKRGPLIANPFEKEGDLDRLHALDDVPHIRRTIRMINEKLPEHIPLIGFAGAPFTVLSYLTEGGSSTNFRKTLRLLTSSPEVFDSLMEFLTDNTIKYYELQRDAGIKVFQLFDTWAGILPRDIYTERVLPYVQKILHHIDLPSIYYIKNSRHLVNALMEVDANILSLCSNVNIRKNKVLQQSGKGIQGNLFPAYLYADDTTLIRAVDDVLQAGRRYRVHVFNLGQGIFPDTEVSKAKLVVDRVHEFHK